MDIKRLRHIKGVLWKAEELSQRVSTVKHFKSVMHHWAGMWFTISCTGPGPDFNETIKVDNDIILKYLDKIVEEQQARDMERFSKLDIE